MEYPHIKMCIKWSIIIFSCAFIEGLSAGNMWFQHRGMCKGVITSWNDVNRDKDNLLWMAFWPRLYLLNLLHLATQLSQQQQAKLVLIRAFSRHVHTVCTQMVIQVIWTGVWKLPHNYDICEIILESQALTDEEKITFFQKCWRPSHAASHSGQQLDSQWFGSTKTISFQVRWLDQHRWLAYSAHPEFVGGWLPPG